MTSRYQVGVKPGVNGNQPLSGDGWGEPGVNGDQPLSGDGWGETRCQRRSAIVR